MSEPATPPKSSTPKKRKAPSKSRAGKDRSPTEAELAESFTDGLEHMGQKAYDSINLSIGLWLTAYNKGPATFAELVHPDVDTAAAVEALEEFERRGLVVLDWRDGPGDSTKYAVVNGRYLVGARRPAAPPT